MENEDNPEISIEENEGGAINPAWNDLLQAVPEEYHEQITPHLRNWDSGVQQRFQQVQSEWSDFKFLKENEISPDDARVSLGLLRAVQEDPRAVYDSLAESYGFGAGEVEDQPTTPDQGNTEIQGLPPEVQQRLDHLQSGYETMAQILLEKRQKEEQAEQDATLQSELASLKQKHGAFNEKFVLAQILNGDSGEDAVKAYQDLVQQVLQENNKPPAPRLLGSGGGGIPGEKAVDPTKLSGAQTKKLVADYLAAHNRANQ